MIKRKPTGKFGLSVGNVLAVAGALLIVLSSLFFVTQQKTETAYAATTDTLNFQGRLMSASGSMVDDGVYNMQFSIYYVSSGGSAQWTEDRLVTNTQGVTIKNGYFSVNLGEYDTFGAINWGNDLYLGMTVRGTTNCAWGSCSPADAEMTPRMKLTSVPYAFKAGNVGSNDTNSASSNSSGVSITTGNAIGATSNSGSIGIDVGTATGTAGTISIGTANTSGITIGRTGVTTTNVGVLTVTQALTANGGATIVGTTTINTTGTANTQIGNATGTFQLDSNNIDISTAGAISGVTGFTQASGNFVQNGAGTFGTGTGAVSLNGATTINGSQLTNTGATLNSAAAISDVAAGGNIGTAAATVDVKTTFNVNQTTAGQTLTLPNPTDTTSGRIVYINNVGSVSFTMYGSVIASGQSNAFIWNGSAWVTSVSLSGSVVNAVGTLNSQTKSADGAVISSNAIYLQSADTSYAGLVDTTTQSFAGNKTFTDNLKATDYISFGNAVAGQCSYSALITCGSGEVVQFGSAYVNTQTDGSLYFGRLNEIEVTNNVSNGAGTTIASGDYLEINGSFNTGTAVGNQITVGNLGAGDVASLLGQTILVLNGGAGTVTESVGLTIDVSGATTNTGITVGGAGIDYGINLQTADTATLWLGSDADGTTANAGIAFGQSRDTNLYRSAANTLQTDDSFVVQGNTTLGDASGDTLTINGTSVSLPNNLNFDTDTLYIDSSNDRVGIGTSSPDFKLEVVGVAPSQNNGTVLSVDATTAASTQSNLSAVRGVLTVAPSGGSGGSYYGVLGEATTSSALIPGATIGGVKGVANYTGTSTIEALYGLTGQVNNTSSGTVTVAAGLNIGQTSNTGGTIGTNYGIFVNPQNAGTSNVGIAIGTASTQTLIIGADTNGTTANGGLAFGNSADTNLYRSAASTLQTDDSFVVGIDLTVNGVTTLNGNTTIGNATTDRLTLTSQLLGGSPLVLQGATDNAFVTTITVSEPTANNVITLPDATGTVVLDSTLDDVAFIQNGNSFGGNAVIGTNDANSLGFETGGNIQLTIANDGAATFQNSTDSTSGLKVLDADGGTSILNVDTTNERVGIGDDTPDYVLDVVGAVPDEDFGSLARFSGTSTTTSNQAVNAVGGIIEANPASASTGVYVGVIGQSGSTSNFVSGANLTGLLGLSQYYGTDSLGTSMGIASQIINNNTGTIDNSYGAAFRDALNFGGGTITNNYGIIVDPQTGGLNDYGVAIGAADTQTLWLSNNADNTTASAGIAFGSSRDTNLYRSAADVLYTDDSFGIGGNLTVGNATTDRITLTAQITGSSPLVLQGATDDTFTTTLSVTDPTANNIITLPNATGTVALVTSGSSTTGVSAFTQGGNTWAGTGTLGLTDNNTLNVVTSGTTRLSISGTGSTTITGGTSGTALTVNNSTSTGNIFDFQDNGTNVLSLLDSSAGNYLQFNVGAARAITVATQTTLNNAGNSLTIGSATGNGSGAGGAMVVGAGNGGTSGIGGALILQAGAGGTTGNGGDANLSGGTATDGNGGAISVTGGSGNGTASISFDPNTGVNGTTEVITTSGSHGLATGDEIMYNQNSGAIRMGLIEGKKYYARNLTSTTISLHPTSTDATNNTNAINLYDPSSGTETHYLYKTNDGAGGDVTISGGDGTSFGTGGDIVFKTAASNAALTTVATLDSFNGSFSLQNSIDSSSGFKVQNTALGGSTDTILNVITDRSNWAETTVLPGQTVENASVIANGYAYVIGGTNNSTDPSTPQATIYSAKVNSNGSIGSWTTFATSGSGTCTGSNPYNCNLPAARTGHTATYINGYIYVVGGASANKATGVHAYVSGNANSTVYFAKVNNDGTLGSWNTTTPIANTASAIARIYHSAETYNGYLYIIGGSTAGNANGAQTVYYAKPGPDGKIPEGNWATTSTLASNRLMHDSVIMNGRVYVVWGTFDDLENPGYSVFDHDEVQYATINGDGTIGTFSEVSVDATTGGFNGRIGHTVEAVNGKLHVYGGGDWGSAATNNSAMTVPSQTQVIDINSSGVPVAGSATYLTGGDLPTYGNHPNNRANAFGASGALYNGYVYRFGGSEYPTQWNTTTGDSSATNVIYTEIPGIRVNGGLDLTAGLDAQTSLGTSAGGAGTLRAGNTSIIGSLEVAQQSYFGSTVMVQGNLSAAGAAYFENSVTYGTATSQSCGAADCTITQANVDSKSAVIMTFSSTGYEAAIPDPTNVTAGKIVYVTAASSTSDFTLCLNDVLVNASYDGTCNTTTGNSIAMRANTTATLIWSGSDWTAAGASSSTDLQAAYNNTLTSAGGAELVLNAAGGAADGLTIRNNSTTPITGALLEVQTSIGSNLFSVNNNATEYANNGGAETSTFTMWTAAPAGGSVSRYTTAGNYIATGTASTSVATTAINHGVRNTLSTSLTANLKYSVSFAVRGTTNFSTLEVVYSRDGTNTSTTACASTQTVTTGKWSRIICTFTAPSSGITSSNAIFIRQTDATSRTFYVDNLSVQVSADINHASDGSVDSALSASTWTAFGALDGLTRDTTTIYDTSGSVAVNTPNAVDRGVINNLSINPSTNTQYLVTFYARSTNTFNDIRVRYTPDNGSNYVSCTDYNTQNVSTSTWTEITCLFTTGVTAVTDANLVIDQPTASDRTFYIDALSITLNQNTANNVQVGGANKGGPTTLFTLDRGASAPVGENNDAYLGSMYYDTVTGRIQCYEADGWGACGAAPDNIVNLNPEYAGAVLNGTGVGTMTADFCSDDAALTVNAALCETGQAKNYYKWTSPQASQQTYSIYVTYQLPATFRGFASDDTVQLTGRVDSTSNAEVTYEMFKSTGSAVTQCGSGETDVIAGGGDTADQWHTYGINGNEATGCSFTSSSASNFVIFKINMKANSNANAYVSTLSFTTNGQ